MHKVELRLVTDEEADARMHNEEICDVHTFGYWMHIPARSGWHHGTSKQYWYRNCFYCNWSEQTFKHPDEETILKPWYQGGKLSG